MITLANGCSYSGLTVTPSNWNTKTASVKKPWRITYRFYDPAFRDNPELWGKQIPIKGMNRVKTLLERQAITADLLKYEKQLLEQEGYNPITCKAMVAQNSRSALDPDTPVITALKGALNRLKIVPVFATTIRSTLKQVETAAVSLGISQTAVSNITRKHIKLLLEECERINPKFSDDSFNKFKAQLSMMFNELLQLEAVEQNPTRDIPNRKKTKKLVRLLTAEEEAKLNMLRETNYAFWRYIKIFFHSGSRTTELLRLRNDDNIQLDAQEFVVTVLKGSTSREDVRAIEDEALPLWQELLAEASPGNYLFSKGLRPGPTPIRPDQINRRWDLHVKKGLNINKRFYELKHLHTDRVDAALDISHAQAANGHTTPVITIKHYAPGHKRRQLERVKKAGIKFG